MFPPRVMVNGLPVIAAFAAALRAAVGLLLAGRGLAALAVFGLLATIHDVAESACLLIPIKENILVTDGGSGREVDAQAAWFLYTGMGWVEQVPDFVRVFERKTDARRRARAHGSEIFMGVDRPLVLATQE